MKFTKEEYSRHGARSVVFTIENRRFPTASVDQDVSPVDLKWGAPSVWFRCENREKNTDRIRDELSTLQDIFREAVSIAKEWNAKTGMPLEREEQ